MSEFKIPVNEEGHNSTQVFVVNKSEDSDQKQPTREYVAMLEKTIRDLRDALSLANERNESQP